MLSVEILSAPHGVQMSCRAATFDSSGGMIGRASGNRLVLPDEDRQISRVHAQIVCRDGQYCVLSRTPNGMEHGGQQLEFGEEASLQDGDTFSMGGYQLRVSLTGGTDTGA